MEPAGTATGQLGINWENTPGKGHGIEMNLALVAMALFLTLAGPGRWALAGDTERRLVEGRRGRSSRPAQQGATRQEAPAPTA